MRQGIFGGFEKRTGALVGRRVKGKSVISAVQHKILKPRTQAQIDQQLKFELVIRFLMRMTYLINIGFKHAAGKGNAFNAAVKYNFRKIIIGASPNYSIDYTKLVFSRGSLAGANTPGVSLGVNAVKVSWLPDVQARFNQNTDRLMIFVYYPDKNIMVSLISYTTRLMLEYEMALPANLAGYPMHVFTSFVSADDREVSNSEYLGVY
jgi:hypothetical protein